MLVLDINDLIDDNIELIEKIAIMPSIIAFLELRWVICLLLIVGAL